MRIGRCDRTSRVPENRERRRITCEHHGRVMALRGPRKIELEWDAHRRLIVRFREHACRTGCAHGRERIARGHARRHRGVVEDEARHRRIRARRIGFGVLALSHAHAFEGDLVDLPSIGAREERDVLLRRPAHTPVDPAVAPQLGGLHPVLAVGVAATNTRVPRRARTGSDRARRPSSDRRASRRAPRRGAVGPARQAQAWLMGTGRRTPA